jgi:hypothetical protein
LHCAAPQQLKCRRIPAKEGVTSCSPAHGMRGMSVQLTNRRIRTCAG